MKTQKRGLSLLTAFLILACSVLVAPHTAVSAENSTVLYINAINANGAEGHSLIITPKKGVNVGTGATSYSWWRSATFEWSDVDGAYIVRSIDLSADGVNGKNNVIPENGFVLLVNIGNDYGNVNYINKYSSDTYYALGDINVGDKAYLAGIDLTACTIDISSGKHYDKDFVSNARIYIGEKPEGVELYTPDTSLERLAAPQVSCPSVSVENADIEITWDAVEGAEYYIVNVNTSSVIPDGHLIYANSKTENTSFTVAAGKVSVGMKYTVSVAAYAKGKRSSFTAREQIFVVSERASQSPFIGIKVLAFGDSLTAFTGWVSMLSGEIGTEVINAGVGGDKTTEALARMQKDVLDKEPDVVLIMFGMNDQSMQIASNTPLISVRAYERNYRKIIEAVQNIGAEPVLMTFSNVCTDSGYYVKGQYGLDYGTDNIQKYFEVIRKLAEEYGINLIDINAKIAEEGIKGSVICAPGDGIHLSAEGHKIYTRIIADYLFNDYFESNKQNEESSEGPSEESVEASEETSEEPSAEPSSAEESETPSEQQNVSGSDSAETSVPDDGNGGPGAALYIILGAAAVIIICAIVFVKRKKK